MRHGPESRVSVVTVSLDRPSLPAACDSVDQQSFPGWHHYVIGDGVVPTVVWSAKRSVFAAAERLGLTQPALNMPYGTPNPLHRWWSRHLLLGEFVCVLDDDNEYHPRFLETMVAALDDRPDAGVVLCALENVREHEESAHDGFPALGRCDMSGMLLRSAVFDHIDFPPEFPDRDAISDYILIREVCRSYGWTRVDQRLVRYGTGKRVYPAAGGDWDG